MVAVEQCNWERKNHNVEKLNTILKFPVICWFLGLLLVLPHLHFMLNGLKSLRNNYGETFKSINMN